jgi:outer membrane protein assembly factor BamB
MACVLLISLSLSLCAALAAQDVGSTAEDPFIFFTPGLAIMDRNTDHDRFFNSVDSTLVVPFSPHASALATFSLQFNDKPRWTTVGNYDWFLERDVTLRAAGGMFEDEFGARVTAFQQLKHFGAGVRLGVVSGDVEVGGFVTLPFAWGFPLRKESLGERVSGRNRVTDLGASTAVSLSLRGDEPSLGTEPEYFFPRDAEWPRFGQGPQGQSATAASLGPELFQAWVSETGGPVRSSAAISGSNAYVGSDDGYLYALDLETGELRWRYRIGSPIASSPAVASGRVFVGSDSGAVYCLLEEGDKRLAGERVGEQLWRFTAGGAVVGSPLVTLSGRAVFGSKDGSLYAVEVVSGKPAWTYHTQGPIAASPVKSEEPISVVDESGAKRTERDVIFCASEDGCLYALTERDGRVLWQVSTGAPITNAPVVWAQRVLAVNDQGRVLALYARDGQEVWTQQLPGAPGGSPAIEGRRVIVPLSTGRLVGLDLATGKSDWTTEVPGRIESTPISIQGPVLYVGSMEGHLYAIDKASGAVNWDFATGGAITASPAVAHGRLVCGSQDGSVYAFGDKAPAEGVATHRVAPTSGLASTKPLGQWPTQKPQPVPNLAPVKRSWAPPPGWPEQPPTLPPGGESTVIPVPKPEVQVPAPVTGQTANIAMRLTSEPADSGELPIDLVNQRETVVAWGATEPSAEVDGQTVRNEGGRIEVLKSFHGDDTYPVTMVTHKGTRDEHVACRLVIVDTSSEPTALRDVAFSPDGDGVGDTIAFHVFGEGPGIVARILDIRDASGHAIRTWSAAGAGENVFIWDGTDLAGKRAPAGMYEVTYTLKDAAGNLKRMKQRVLLQRAGERTAGG